jgi:hypothetical protein
MPFVIYPLFCAPSLAEGGNIPIAIYFHHGITVTRNVLLKKDGCHVSKMVYDFNNNLFRLLPPRLWRGGRRSRSITIQAIQGFGTRGVDAQLSADYHNFTPLLNAFLDIYENPSALYRCRSSGIRAEGASSSPFRRRLLSLD